MATGSPFLPRIQRDSHCTSCGQTLPQIAGRLFLSFMIRTAFAISPERTASINSGIETSTGTAFHAFGFLALQAALRLPPGKFKRKAQSHFVKVLNPVFSLLHRHILAGDIHPFFFGQFSHLFNSLRYRAFQLALVALPPALNRLQFLGTIKCHPRQQTVPVDLVSVEFGTVHAHEPGALRPSAPGSLRTFPCRPP